MKINILITLLMVFLLSSCLPNTETTVGELLGIPTQPTVNITPAPAPPVVPVSASANQTQMVTLTPIATPAPEPVALSPVTVEPFDLIKICIADALSGDFSSAFNSCLSSLNLTGVLASYTPQLIQYLTGMDGDILEAVWAGVFGGTRSAIPYHDYVNKGAVAEAIAHELVAGTNRSTLSRGVFDFQGLGGDTDFNLVCQVE